MSEFHRLLQRQLKRHMPAGAAPTPEQLEAFIQEVNESYRLYESNRELIEHAMRLGNVELQEKNEQLIADKEKQDKVIARLREAVSKASPELANAQEDDLMRVAEVLVQAVEQQKLVEENLNKARQAAEDSLEARKLFLANISHEIRTPMNAISGMALLLAESDLTPQQHDYVNAIINSAEGLMVIINDVLDMSKMESGKFSLESIDFGLDKLTQSILRGMSVKAKEKKIQLRYEQDFQVAPFLKGDPTRLSQVLTNLISNAIKFTHEGGVTLGVALLEESKDGQQIEFSVTDTGIGIDQDKLDTIFENFTQEDNTITRKYGGTGLGLSISKSIVELMGGELKVSSKKGEGSRFSFIITLPVGEEVSESRQSVIAHKNLERARILLVEDNELNRFLAITLLTKWNARIDSVNNGLEALEYLKNQTTDLVLMDLQMPEMDGFRATYELRNTLKIKTPIIALTANALESERQKCLSWGMNDYVSKPYHPEALFGAIQKCLVLNGATQKTEVNTSALFSLTKVFGMYDGNKTHVVKTAEVFLRQARLDLSAMKDALNQREYKDVKALLHKMGPGIALFDIQEILDLFELIRKAADNRNADQLASHVAHVERALLRVEDGLLQELPEMQR